MTINCGIARFLGNLSEPASWNPFNFPAIGMGLSIFEVPDTFRRLIQP